MELSWFVLIAVFLILLILELKKFNNYLESKYVFEKNYRIYTLKYDEKEVIGHLDYIINEALENYVVMNIIPKDLYYINNQMENTITQELTDIITKRIPQVLYSRLTLIYDPGEVGNVIGEKIYSAVLEYVLDFNTKNVTKTKKE